MNSRRTQRINGAWVWMCHQEIAEMETGHDCECVIRRLWRWRLGMSVNVSSGNCRDENWACAADVEEKRSFLVRVERTRSDVVQSAGHTRQLQIHVTTTEHSTISMNQWIDRSMIDRSIHRSVHPSIHRSVRPSVHPSTEHKPSPGRHPKLFYTVITM